MGLLSRGVNRLARVQATNESETVLISRPAAGSTFAWQDLPVTAVIGGPGFGQQATSDIPGRIGDWAIDFVIRISDWITAGCTSTPQEGDLITRTIDIGGASTVVKFRVITQGNIPAWDWGEPERVTYRIHAKYESLS